MSNELSVVLLAALPVIELRGAIPVGIEQYELLPMWVYFLAVTGNLLPLVPLYFGLNAVRNFFEKRVPWITRVIDHQINRAGKRVEKKYAQYGAFALLLFTALPLPLTGLWTATLAAVALKIPFKFSVMGIVPGVLIAGVIVTLLTLGTTAIF